MSVNQLKLYQPVLEWGPQWIPVHTQHKILSLVSSFNSEAPLWYRVKNKCIQLQHFISKLRLIFYIQHSYSPPMQVQLLLRCRMLTLKRKHCTPGSILKTNTILSSWEQEIYKDRFGAFTLTFLLICHWHGVQVTCVSVSAKHEKEKKILTVNLTQRKC